MWKKLRNLILFLLIPTFIYSNNTVKDTLIQINPEYFKVANAIFAERDYLLTKDSLNTIEINALDNLKNLYKQSLENCQLENDECIEDLVKTKGDLVTKKSRLRKSIVLNCILGTIIIILLL